MSIENRDCVVIGGGPAGSTFRRSPANTRRRSRHRAGEREVPAVSHRRIDDPRRQRRLRDLEVFDDAGAVDLRQEDGHRVHLGPRPHAVECRLPPSARSRATRRRGGDIIDVTGQDFRACSASFSTATRRSPRSTCAAPSSTSCCSTRRGRSASTCARGTRAGRSCGTRAAPSKRVRVGDDTGAHRDHRS